MNKRERFEAFLHNEPVDRVPVAFFHHFMGVEDYMKGLRAPELFKVMVEGHWVAKQKNDPDFLKIMNDVLQMMPLDVAQVRTAGDLKYVDPPAMDSPFVEKTKELTTSVLEYFKDEDIPALATGFSPVNDLYYALMMGDLTNRDGMARLFAEDPVAVSDFLKRVGEMKTEVNRILMKDLGLDGIYFSVMNQNQMLPDEGYAKYIAPIEKDMVAAIEAEGVCLLHICGYEGRTNNLELFRDYGPSAVNWAVHTEQMSLKEGKEFFGKPVMGGFAQDTVIYKGTKEEIKAEVKQILSEAGQIGVAIGADCTIPEDVDDTHFVWAREGAAEFAEENR